LIVIEKLTITNYTALLWKNVIITMFTNTRGLLLVLLGMGHLLTLLTFSHWNLVKLLNQIEPNLIEMIL